MKSEFKARWWEWLLLAVVVETLFPKKKGRKWEWLVLAAILSPFL